MEWILAVIAIICGYGYWRRGQQFDVMKAYALKLEQKVAELEKSNSLKNDQVRDSEDKNAHELDI